MEQTGNVSQERERREAMGGDESIEEATGVSPGQYLDKALHLIGKKMRNAANIVRERAPREGTSRNALESASDVLDATGRYMMREDVSENVRGVIKRYPLRTLGVCFLFGFLAGSATRGVRR